MEGYIVDKNALQMLDRVIKIIANIKDSELNDINSIKTNLDQINLIKRYILLNLMTKYSKIIHYIITMESCASKSFTEDFFIIEGELTYCYNMVTQMDILSFLYTKLIESNERED